MRPAIVAVLAGCGSSLALHPPDGVRVTPLHAAWVVTDPELTGAFHLASYRDDVYVVACSGHARVARIAHGEVVWARELAGDCLGAGHGKPVAASEAGVIVAIADGRRLDVVALARDGAPRWTHDDAMPVREASVAAAGKRAALCIEREDHALVAIELTGGGRASATRGLASVHGAACSFDERGELWVTGAVDGEGTQAIAVASGRRLVLSRRTVRVFAAASGFVVGEPDSRHLEYVDLEGMPRWFLNLDTNECELYPEVIAASPTRLVASVPIACGARGENRIGDLAIENEQTERAAPFAKRTLVVQLAMPAGHAIAVDDLGEGADAYRYALLDHGVLAFGRFEHELELGTTLRAPEHRIDCNKPHDEDDPHAQNCKEGYQVVRWTVARPFVAVLAP